MKFFTKTTVKLSVDCDFVNVMTKLLTPIFITSSKIFKVTQSCTLLGKCLRGMGSISLLPTVPLCLWTKHERMCTVGELSPDIYISHGILIIPIV